MTRRDGFRAHLVSLGPFTEVPASFCPRGSPGRRETSWESSCAPFPYLPPPTVGSAPRPAGFPSELSLILPASLHPCPQEHLHFCSCLDPHGPPPPSLPLLPAFAPKQFLSFSKAILQSEDGISPASCWTAQWLPVLRIVALTKPAGTLLPPSRASAQTSSS